MTAYVCGPSPNIGRAVEHVLENPRSYVVAQDEPRRLGPFLVVERILAGCHFAPTGNTAGLNLDQDHPTFLRTAEAGLEEVHQRHPDLAQRYLFWLESHSPRRYVPLSSD